MVVQPFLAIVVGALFAALAQAPLWAIVYVMTGLTLDLLAGRPPTFRAAYDHWRAGFIKGAIYGGVFMFLLLAARLRRCATPPSVPSSLRSAMLLSPLLGLLFPLDPDDRRQRRRHAAVFRPAARSNYRDPRAYVRGVVAGIGAPGR